MNPVLAFVRGYRLAVSNAELAGVYLAASITFALSIMIPLGLFTWAFVHLLDRDGTGAPGWSGAVLALQSHWVFLAAWAIGLGLWITALSIGYLFAQAGIIGQLVRAHRAARAEKTAGGGALGFSAGMRYFAFRQFVRDAVAFGGRLTLLASFYGFIVTLALVLVCGVGLACVYLVILHRWVFPFVLAVLLLLGTGLGVLALLLGLHYRLAAVIAVEGPCSPRMAVRMANRTIGREFWPFMGLCGLGILLSWSVGAIFGIVSVPVSLLSLVPVLRVAMIALRILLLILQSAAGSVVYVVVMGAFVVFASSASGVQKRGTAGHEACSLLDAT